jgi:hypothetical protein
VSREWYVDALGLTSGHGGDEYEMLMDGGVLVLQLHHMDDDHHPHLLGNDETLGALGNGVALWFETAAYHAAVDRIRGAGAEVLEPDHVNENAHHREIWLRDPDGYVVVVSSPFGQID